MDHESTHAVWMEYELLETSRPLPLTLHDYGITH